jgi:hypothetical protein
MTAVVIFYTGAHNESWLESIRGDDVTLDMARHRCEKQCRDRVSNLDPETAYRLACGP